MVIIMVLETFHMEQKLCVSIEKQSLIMHKRPTSLYVYDRYQPDQSASSWIQQPHELLIFGCCRLDLLIKEIICI